MNKKENKPSFGKKVAIIGVIGLGLYVLKNVLDKIADNKKED